MAQMPELEKLLQDSSGSVVNAVLIDVLGQDLESDLASLSLSFISEILNRTKLHRFAILGFQTSPENDKAV
jgi:hypothetical protein